MGNRFGTTFPDKINGGTTNLGQLQNKTHTENWALAVHPRDNGHVTH